MYNTDINTAQFTAYTDDKEFSYQNYIQSI